ncbi:MAG TPA: M12 family metallopeptidase, partial [Pirellulaceae bacterium]|nr:M12 family metallopeptidase [Pirellulaceae bacterium]
MARQASARKSDKVTYRCGLRPTPPRMFAADVGANRAAAIIVQQNKWVNGTTLRYWFFPGPATQKQAMRRAFKVWQDVGIGLRFAEVNSRDDAQVRIAFANDGSWSYLGRDVLQIPKSQPTMNIGWDISRDLDTGIHEIGHTLGLPHEHQNPNSGIVWDEEAVYASLAKPPNRWSRQKTHWNIIRKLETAEVTGSDWDPNSIMHYPFEAGLILEPARYRNGLTPAGGLSRRDKRWVKKFYPPLAARLTTIQPYKSHKISAQTGGFHNFAFRPDATRRYT